MKIFNLEKALAGEKVITFDGRNVDQIHHFTIGSVYAVVGVVNNNIATWSEQGSYQGNGKNTDLFMAPKKLSGFVNVYPSSSDIFSNRQSADNMAYTGRIACIDISQFDERHGL